MAFDPMNITNLEEARKYFENDRFATVATGATIESVSPNQSVCKVKIEDVHKNAMGALMGGVSLALSDFAFAVATNGNGNCVTVNISSSFAGACKGDELIATAIPSKLGKSLVFYDVIVEDNLGNLVTKSAFVGKRV